MIKDNQIKKIWAIVGNIGSRDHLDLFLSRKGLNSMKKLTEEEAEMLISELKDLQKKADRQRKRIFSAIRSIKLLAPDEKLGEADVLAYLRQVKGFTLPYKRRLNDYNSQELSQIIRQLDAIRPKMQKKYRNTLQIQ